MERLICRACGEPVGSDDIVCGNPDCYANLTAVSAVIEAGNLVTPRPIDPVAMDITCPSCGTACPPGSRMCPHCLSVLETVLTIALLDPPWQTVLEAGGTLILGRDPGSPAAAALSGHDAVSRRHAAVTTAPDGAATVTDLYSTNGTWLDQRRLEPGVRHPLRSGAALRLASTATFQVE
ncbi:FHA domain-containing protein [Micromonospora lupini]|uniref:FHA domain-containing protein n=1 Tax=Micromonospora lupini TaxID=285679 RepID=UPI00224F84A6|nr:FHA domain-containing protein [Micromonospora lupini]MCX5064296.1 FHA domain-containing protein [Micromonospora lupini]